ncbi:hypothetical protein GCM10023089_13690 [Quisquiliibacterium transsilvanicum]
MHGAAPTAGPVHDVEQRGQVTLERRSTFRGQACGAVAFRHVEHILVVSKGAGLCQQLSDDLKGCADGGVVAAGRGRLLAALECIEVDEGFHLQPPL